MLEFCIVLLSGSHAKILAACLGGKLIHFCVYYPTSLKFSKNILDLQQYAAGFLAYTRSVKCGRNAVLQLLEVV